MVSQEAAKINPSAPETYIPLPALSVSDSLALMQLPCLPSDPQLQKASLPPVHDNAGQPFFRPLFEQVASECGQYSSIAFTFTYEMNYTRNLPSNIPANQYPTHYTYNIMNGGFGWHGVSYFHSFEIARVNGHPNVEDFGSLNSCGPSYWMSGYDKYKRGMSNKIEDVYQIPVGTTEGLITLKNWLHNHLTGDDVGGIACFYSSTPWNIKLLPQGTPEGGRHVISEFLKPATHAATITGYNDSIRYDYNGDGQYTNDIDLNGDGILDMRDWEIGGLRFTDSYLGGVTWADSGFCYMMYKTLADKCGEGGIWNNVVHVVKIREGYEPLLSMKVNIEHNCRDRLKIMAGVSEDPSNIIIDYVMGFPIFDYQGGCQHMQGGWEPEAKTLELGLDITPLLGRITSGDEASFYLLVMENDPNGYGAGQIIDFSIIDHMNGDQEYKYPSSNIPLQQNGLTVLGIEAALSFEDLQITDESLPLAYTGEEYSHQMSAEGGTPPYTWNLVRHFQETNGIEPLPDISDEKLVLPDTIHSKAMKVLDFEFPFYGNLYDTVWIHSDGFIMFEQQDYPWPYLYDEHLMIKKTRNISACLNNFLYANPSADNGIWYDADENRAAFRWKMTASYPQGKEFEFALILHKDGRIEFFFDDDTFLHDQTWAAGVSNGDGINYQFTTYSSLKSAQEYHATLFTPKPFPADISLSKDGLLSGVPVQNYPGIDLVFDITDANLLNERKSYKFYSYVEGIADPTGTLLNYVRIWPIPARDNLEVEFRLAERTDLSLELADPAGRILAVYDKMISEAGINRKVIRLDNTIFKPGIYYLLFRKDGQIFHAEKVIKIN